MVGIILGNLRKGKSGRLVLLTILMTFGSVGILCAGGGKDKDKDVDWRLLFNQLFALEMRKDLPQGKTKQEKMLLQKKYEKMLKKFTYFSPKDFNEIIKEVTSKKMSHEVFENIDKVLGQEKNRKLISQLDFKKSIPQSLLKKPRLKEFLKEISQLKKRSYEVGENYFASPEGKNMAKALTSGGNKDGIMVVMVPGFASHSLKDYIFEELTKDANLFHGREITRPLKELGPELLFQDYRKYYQKRKDHKDSLIDVLQPLGDELGNTVGPSGQNATILKHWLDHLPESYKNKKIIFVTYSKGAPVVLDLFRQDPQLSKRTLGIVSYGGTVQGTGVAREAIDELTEILGSEDVEKALEDMIAKNSEGLKVLISYCLSGDFGLMGYKIPDIFPQIEKVLSKFGIVPEFLKEKINRNLQSKDLMEIFVGGRELTPLERIKSNLKYLNNESFPHPVAMFNLSAVTNVKDFTMPGGGLNEDGSREQSLIAPTLKTGENGLPTIDFEKFSLDALFLYLSSLNGFKGARGGLFDTQVELANSKSPFLDKSTFQESLTEKELDKLWNARLTDPQLNKIFADNKILSKEILQKTPRNELIKEKYRHNLDSIDLGEIRGHHWYSMVQAFRPPPEISAQHAKWDFPRMAYMRALLQTIGIYHLIQEETK